MLRVFLAVAEEGALALAAQKLGRTPSALSMALSQ
ncbi:MAG: LysR family transcriptional regulator, partial [Paracoccaceae bacterium]